MPLLLALRTYILYQRFRLVNHAMRDQYLTKMNIRDDENVPNLS